VEFEVDKEALAQVALFPPPPPRQCFILWPTSLIPWTTMDLTRQHIIIKSVLTWCLAYDETFSWAESKYVN
jgi:hypothetical protein